MKEVMKEITARSPSTAPIASFITIRFQLTVLLWYVKGNRTQSRESMGLLGDELQRFSVTASKKTTGSMIRDTGNGDMEAISKPKEAG
jgi:hypothetical protein